MPKKHFYEGVATLVGATIGAGVLGIPYVVATSGFWTGILVLLLIFTAILFTNLYLGEIILRTKGKHQLTGYAEKYLGKTGKNIMTASMIFGIYSSLIAYILGEGNALSTLLGGSPALFSFIFFGVGSLILFFGLGVFEEFELFVSGLVITTIIVISFIGAGSIDPANLNGFHLESIFIPFGVILFAFIGSPAIPELVEELGTYRKEVKKAIIFGTTIPLLVYLLFTVVSVGVVGENFMYLAEKDRVASSALGLFLGNGAVIFGNLFAILAMTTAFLALGMALKEMFEYDYKLSKTLSWGVTIVVPFIVVFIDSFIYDIANFITVLGIAGAVTGGLIGILIVLMHRKAKKNGSRKPEYQLHDNRIIGIALILFFLLGILYQVLATLHIV